MKLKEQTKNGRIIPFLPDGDYYFEKGIAAYKYGDLQRAKKYVERAIVFEPNDPEYLCQLAAIFAELEQFDHSNRLLKKVVFDIDPSLAECFFFMANNYAYLGRYEEALREIKHYMSLEPNGTFFEEASDLYKLLVVESGGELGDQPDYISDHEKGRQLLESGDYKKAIYYFQKAINERPEFWAAHNNLAIAFFSNGQPEKGIQQIDIILQKDPGNIHALCNKVTFYHQLGEQEEVDKLLPTLHKLYPLYPEGKSKLGATYFFLGQDKKALHWLSSAERSGLFDDQTFHYWLAVTSYRLGYREKALKAWARVDFFSETPFQPFEYGKIKDLLKEDNLADHLLVRSLLEHEAKKGQLESQLLSLFMLHEIGDEQALKVMKEISLSHDFQAPLRKVAKSLMDSSDKTTQDPGLTIMLTLQKQLGDSRPLLDDLTVYKWWFYLLPHLEMYSTDSKSWSAALEYRWVNHLEKGKATQSEICTKYGLSLYKLRRHLSFLDEMDLEH